MSGRTLTGLQRSASPSPIDEKLGIAGDNRVNYVSTAEGYRDGSGDGLVDNRKSQGGSRFSFGAKATYLDEERGRLSSTLVGTMKPSVLNKLINLVSG